MEYFSKKNQQFLNSLEAVSYLVVNDKEINGEIFSFVTYNGVKYFSEWYGFYTGCSSETPKYGKLMYQRSYDYNENYVNLLRTQSLFRRHSELCGRFICYHTILKIVEGGNVLGVVTLYDSNLFFETYLNNIGTYFETHWDIFRWILVSYTIFSNLAILHKNNVYYLNVHPSSISYNDNEVISRFMKFSRFKNSCTGDCYTYSGLKENINSNVLKIGTIFTKEGQNAEKAMQLELKMIDFFSALVTILELYINDGTHPSENYFTQKEESFLFERMKERCSQKKAETPHIRYFVHFLLENLQYILEGKWGNSIHLDYSPDLFVAQTEKIFEGCIPKAMMENHRRCYAILLEEEIAPS